MYKGTSASAGIGIGKAVIVEEVQLVITRQAVNDVEEEVQRFKGALDETIKATEKLAEDLATRVGEKEAEIMQGHMMLLADPMLTGEIENSVRNDGVNSEYAIENVCNMYADMFASMGDERCSREPRTCATSRPVCSRCLWESSLWTSPPCPKAAS